MRHWKQYLLFSIILLMLLFVKFGFTGYSFANTIKISGANLREEDWNSVIAADANEKNLVVNIDGREYTNIENGLYMDDNLKIMLPSEMLCDAFDCSAHLYDRQMLLIEKKDDILKFELNKNYYIRNEEKQKRNESIAAMVERDGKMYVPFETLAKELQYSYQWDIEKMS